MAEFKITTIGDLHLGKADGYDGSDLNIPDADLLVGLGDLVNTGAESEYEVAVNWAKSLKHPLILLRGNHDNGLWNRHARRVCCAEMTTALREHSTDERVGMVEWNAMIWEEVAGPILSFDRRIDWNCLPATVIQRYLAKLKDLTPGYYTFNAGGMKFICLDTSDWLLGAKQMQWLEGQLASAKNPVVLIGHHHFLPVGTETDIIQIYERDFLRQLMLRQNNIVAHLHGHAHWDRWWKYGNVDILAVRDRACRTITFRDGQIVESILDGKSDSPNPFFSYRLYAQCMQPGRVVCVTDNKFEGTESGLVGPGIDCLGWLESENEDAELIWSMRLPEDVPSDLYQLSFQVRCPGGCRFEINSPALKQSIVKDVSPSPDIQRVNIEIGQLAAGLTCAKLQCSSGWGYAAVTAVLEPMS